MHLRSPAGRMGARASAVAVLVFGLAACTPFDSINTCTRRGTSRVFSGKAQYSGHVASGGATMNLDGSGMLEVAMSDFWPYGGTACTESNIEFTVAVSDCVLWVAETAANYDADSGDFTGGSGSIEPGQVCNVTLGTDVATLEIGDGVLTVNPDSIELTLPGIIGGWNTGAGNGALQWWFDGS